ncbi:hypothetical protein A9Q78_09905 [Methylophaga sp. 41_12_T18]|nr:hypothetical protein A9Q78_09905 [Methylophaga sp. 41_12_T18]
MAVLRTWLVVTAAMLGLWQVAIASEQLSLSVGSWQLEQQSADNLTIEFNLTTNGLALEATADSLKLAEPIGRLNKVSLSCDEVQLLAERYLCKQGNLIFNHAELGSQNIQFSLTAQPEASHYQLHLTGLKLAEAEIALSVNLHAEQWHVAVDIPQLELTSLLAYLSPYLAADTADLLTGWSYDSKLTMTAELDGHGSQLEQAKFKLTAAALNLMDADSQFVTEDAKLDITLDLKHSSEQWQFDIASTLLAGQGYAEPVFIDFMATPLSLIARGSWMPTQQLWQIEQVNFKQHDIVDINGQLSGRSNQLESAEIELKQTSLNNLYPIWIQPFIVDSALANLELAGNVGVKLSQQQEAYQVSIEFDETFIDDEHSRFGLYDLNGHFGWTNSSQIQTSHLTWQGGYVYAIPLGGSEFVAETQASELRLQQRWTLPILDGELQLSEFSLIRPEFDNTQWSFAGELSPISMEALSSALEWPTLHGKLSGVIPKVNYHNQQVQMDGALIMKVFDGTTVLQNLKLDHAFGSLPQLYADVELTNLDLETLTKTFEFGKITGKLDGQLNQLRLSNWQPVAFDAQFYTPEDDNSRHRISQKAVDSLSKLGGASGVLQRSFLRFFEDFSYQRLGLSCKLTNDVCQMAGVSEAEQGYYIVKGGGLPPRINVVGYTRRVGWTDLLERLKSVSNSSGPVIQ